MNYYGPEYYIWEKDTECYFFNEIDSEIDCNYGARILALPRDWLVQYDSTIPIFASVLPYKFRCYLDIEKQGWVASIAYFLRDRFHLYKGNRHPPQDGLEPHPIGKGGVGWCITQLSLYNPHELEIPRIQSYLSLRSLDFSEFDAKVEAEGLKCPVPYNNCLKLKDGQFFNILTYSYNEENPDCFCVICRKDYQAIEVSVDVVPHRISLHLLDPIK